MSKVILDLCGGTGSWSEPYREAGYEVALVTFPDYDVTNFNIIEHGNVLTFPSQTPGVPDLYILIESIYGILAAPPCTMFSRARTTAKTPRDFAGAMKIVKSCLATVEIARSHPNTTLKFWALENPMGLLRQFLGNPPHSFRGWEWGDDHMKFTDLWGYYRMPTKKIKEQPKSFNRKKWAAPKSPDKVMDFRALDLPDDSFSLVVFDPPHFLDAGERSFMAQKYGTLKRSTWRDDITKGFAECFRVLKPGGVLIFKWNEYHIRLKDILELAPYTPLFGHPSGKQQNTHWVTFMKLDHNKKG